MTRRKPRVRIHLVDAPDVRLPSLEGILVSRRHREYLLAVPRVIASAEGQPVELASRFAAIPKERVAFYEVLS